MPIVIILRSFDCARNFDARKTPKTIIVVTVTIGGSFVMENYHHRAYPHTNRTFAKRANIRFVRNNISINNMEMYRQNLYGVVLYLSLFPRPSPRFAYGDWPVKKALFFYCFRAIETQYAPAETGNDRVPLPFLLRVRNALTFAVIHF